MPRVTQTHHSSTHATGSHRATAHRTHRARPVRNAMGRTQTSSTHAGPSNRALITAIAKDLKQQLSQLDSNLSMSTVYTILSGVATYAAAQGRISEPSQLAKIIMGATQLAAGTAFGKSVKDLIDEVTNSAIRGYNSASSSRRQH
ncbi:hypothetical protein [Agarilytica rhodophyticola]|uniref:hypothetical protein n=1 Tax=Agarilytica rhodophyticola TaxID=1737490 RepID=UPI000B348FFF|nr:hypothetical protein [Agarilytica rhodophyticola]